jgi:hypothetical protein
MTANTVNAPVTAQGVSLIKRFAIYFTFSP